MPSVCVCVYFDLFVFEFEIGSVFDGHFTARNLLADHVVVLNNKIKRRMSRNAFQVEAPLL